VNQIHHDNIVQITDLVVGDDYMFIVMELLVGTTLSAELGRHGPMPLSRIALIGRQLCSALAAVHQAGIVHRDLKPGNIMLVNRGGNPDFVKLLDFGIAKLREESFEGPRTLTGQVVGTPGFMAPEQLLGEPVDARSDLYSLGVVLFGMLTGQMPHVAATWTEMMLCQIRDKPRTPEAVLGKEVPQALANVIMQCLERDPLKRPNSEAEVAAALQRLP
jgi:serine/threonine-protein kinase